MKRFLSIMLSILMVVTMIPFTPLTASAATTPNYIANIGVAQDGSSGSTGVNDCKSELSGHIIIDRDLNDDAGGDYVYMGYKTTTDPSKAITGIVFRFGKNPPSSITYNGYTFYLVGGQYETNTASQGGYIDLNAYAGGDYIYTYVTRDQNYGAPLTAMTVNESSSYSGWNTGTNTSGNVIDLNDGAGGDYLYLHYKRFSETVSATYHYFTSNLLRTSSTESGTVKNHLDPMTKVPDVAKTVSADGDTFTFVGWREDDVAGAPTITSPSTTYMNAPKTFRAVYSRTVELRYHAIGATGGPATQTANQYVNIGTTVEDMQPITFTVSSTVPTHDSKCAFLGWSRSGDNKIYKANDRITTTGGAALFAEWQDHVYVNGVCTACGYHTCSFDDNGFCTVGNDYEPAELKDGYYQIKNGGNLFWYANYINTVDRTANAVLTADIDLENRPWTPIGSTGENSNNFRGVFDGQNHTITGLNVEGGRAGLGFFGEVRTGTVKNFTIYGEVVANTEVDYVGGVIGSACGVNGETDLERNGAVIQNITSYVNLTAKAHGVGKIGGLVGYANHQSLIENCSWYGTFDAGEYRVDNGAGGFIGRIQESSSEVTIRNCGAYGTIKTNYAGDYNDTATIYMGGFLSFSNTDAQTTLENCLFAGKFERGENLTDEAFLGAFGTLRSVNAIKNCYYLGDDGLEAVHSDSPLNSGSDNVEITKVTAEQLTSGETAYKLGDAWGQNIGTDDYPILGGEKIYCGYASCGASEVIYTNDSDATTEEKPNHSTGAVGDKEATCASKAYCSVCESYYGEVDKTNHDSSVECENGFCPYGCYEPAVLNNDGVYEISNAGQLYWFAAQVDAGKKSISGKLMADIVVNEGTVTASSTGLRAWNPIGYYNSESNYITIKGTFDGNNKTVSGLYFNKTTARGVGLFSCVDSGSIVKNVGVINSYINGRMYVGGVAGCVLSNGTVENCYNTGTVGGTDEVGGVIGSNYGTVNNSYNTGAVNGRGSYVGGVVGRNFEKGITQNCYNTGTVRGSEYVGGVIGEINGTGTVENSYNTGIVSGNTFVGGVLGYNYSNLVQNCYNTGNISGSGDDVGGVAGWNYEGTVQNCYNTGTVSGVLSVGGVIGGTYKGRNINCYNIGTVSGESYVGGVMGKRYTSAGTATNCYYLIGCAKDGNNTVQYGIGNETKGSTTADSEGSTIGKTAEQFKSGEVAYLLNSPFGQNIGIDDYPVLDGKKVYYGYASCAADAVMVYTNNSTASDTKPGHTGGEATCVSGKLCEVCGAEYGEIDPDNHDFDENGKCINCKVQAVASSTINGEVTYYLTLNEAIVSVDNCSAEDKAVVKLLSDVALGSSRQYILSGEFTLDLAGHKITAEHIAIEISGESNPVVTFVDSSEAKTGGVFVEKEGDPESGYQYIALNIGPAKVVIEGGTYLIDGRLDGCPITASVGEVTIKGGTFYGCVSSDYQSSMDIYGGTFINTEEYGYCVNSGLEADVNIYGGEFIASGYDGGTLSALNGKLTVYGGTFTSETDITAMDKNITLNIAEGKTEGAKFINGLKACYYTYGVTLADSLAEGMAYWQGDKMIALTDEQIEITGGDVVIKAECLHGNYTDGLCDICGIECAHENLTSGVCDVCGLSFLSVKINMIDGYGDGWNYAEITVKEFVDGSFSEIAVATIEQGDEAVFTINLKKDRTYIFTWNEGEYPDECAFEIYVDGEIVCSTTMASIFEDQAILYTNCKHSGGTQNCGGYKCEICGLYYGEGTGEHTGGNATCIEQAECEVCGKSYGELEEHDTYGSEQTCKGYYCNKCEEYVGEKDETKHIWYYGRCDLCGEEYPDSENCEHDWINGECSICGTVCPHEEYENGKCTVCGCYMAFELITGEDVTYYHSFSEALEAAEDGSTIKLMKNVVDTDSVEINKAITFDFNGNKWEQPSSGQHTVNANVTFIDSVGGGKTNYSIHIANPCTFKGGTYEKIRVVYETEDTLEDFLGDCYEYYDYYTDEMLDLTGETETNTTVTIKESHTGGKATCTEKAVCEVCGASYGEVDKNAHDWSNGNGICADCGEPDPTATAYVSKNGNIIGCYATLNEALDAVANCTEDDKAVVKLLKDIDVDKDYIKINSGVFTLELNSKTISGKDMILYITDGAVVTVQNGAIKRISSDEEHGSALSVSGSTAYIINCDVTNDYAAHGSGVGVSDSATVEIIDSNLSADERGLYVQYFCHVTISGDSEITSPTMNAIESYFGSTVEIKGGTITAPGYGVYADDGVVTISGGVISGGESDLYSDGVAFKLICSEGKDEGPSFPGGITVTGGYYDDDYNYCSVNLKDIIGEGAGYWQGDTMVAVLDGQTEITGGDVVVKAYDEPVYSGWTELDGNWYYYDPETNEEVSGVARVPYPAEKINGVSYGPDQETLDYCTSKGTEFIDGETGLFVFDEDGKFQSDLTDLVTYENEIRYVKNGFIGWHPGFVEVDGELYYFVGDEEVGGNKGADGDIWLIRPNGFAGFAYGDIYNFKNGKLSGANGISDGKYYENSKLMVGKGLVEIEVEGEKKYIYVRSTGNVVANADFWIAENNFNIVPGMYSFDENGYMKNVKFTNKNGIYFENGAYFYYVDGVKNYAGLIQYSGEASDGTVYENDWIYVR
ncbi:MAG: hypothetical protein IJ262_08610, partial [Clostridia bacterium]|nr:hypothetical protein [Clostridia bacterium]